MPSVTGKKALALGLVAALLGGSPVWAQQPSTSAQSAQSAPIGAPGLAWPRNFDVGDNRLQLYQPQIESWEGDLIGGRAALAIGPKDGAPVYGYAHFTARATVDKSAGLVHLEAIAVDTVDVATAPQQAGAVRKALESRLPKNGITVALVQLQASYAVNKKIADLRTQPVQNEPPKIVFVSTLTILVPVAGQPVLRPVDGAREFQRVINTQPLLLKDAAGTFHLQAAGAWYEAPSLAGPWVVTPQVPQALQAAAKAAVKTQKADPLLSQDGKPVTPPPAIRVATEPTELIQTNGQPELLPVDGTQLMSMKNADHAVFMDPNSNAYYVLISGRWFRSTSLDGAWSYVANDALPADFAKISTNDPKANVLVSVAGTPQAKEAAIAATIPQTATVKKTTTAKVSYDGEPKFVAIPGTVLKYAVNTPQPVIQVDRGTYYMVSQGVWFVAASPMGPWKVATFVPEVIYTIPITSPISYVTYVRIYSVQPETVVVGYTPGYMGVIVQPGGTVVYGTGYYCNGYVGTYWYGCPATYGYGAGFSVGSAVGFGFGFAAGWAWGAAVTPYWGPYWGAGPWGGHWGYVNVNAANVYGRWGGDAVVGHAWGTTPYGTEWGARGVAGTTARGTDFQGRSAAAFNPYTGNYAAGREGSYHNPYTGASGAGRAGVEGNAYTGNYAAGREGVEHNPATGSTEAARAGTVGNAYTGNAAAGRQSAGYNTTTGTAHASQTTATRVDGQVNVDSKGVATNQHTGNSVAWNNGNVYTDHNGNIYQHDGSGWSQRSGNSWQPVDRSADMSGLDSERQARDWSSQRAYGGGDRFGGGGYGGFHGGGGFRR
ncbi:carbohydrate-binding family V/XII [Azorhizobium doebereinerae]|uniref:carbohydrate-binding family V/XII n=1 Tax=Azorhizobium doebereinerae TaxID=281091 RepID=UPI000688FC64|nr:carbohydrate-binding family V/XII [Azorhizobium doebereinerae]